MAKTSSSESNFEQAHSAFEKDIEELSRIVREQEPDLTKEALRSALGQKIYPQAATPTAPTPKEPAAGSSTKQFLPSYIQSESPEIRMEVERLIDTAWHKGIRAAVKAAKNNPLLLDAFHDALTDKLYDEFQKRGLIK